MAVNFTDEGFRITTPGMESYRAPEYTPRSGLDMPRMYLWSREIFDCFDASGKLIKAIWKPLPVSAEWNQLSYDIALNDQLAGVQELDSVGLRILFVGDGPFYVDAIELKN